MEKKIGSFSADFRFRAEGKKVTSRAENPSARAVARASLARTHHYKYVKLYQLLDGSLTHPKMLETLYVEIGFLESSVSKQ